MHFYYAKRLVHNKVTLSHHKIIHNSSSMSRIHQKLIQSTSSSLMPTKFTSESSSNHNMISAYCDLEVNFVSKNILYQKM